MVDSSAFRIRFHRSLVGRRILYAVALFTFVLMCDTARAEMRIREGTYVRLTSDVADDAVLGDFVDSFDAAVPQWLAFWGLPLDRVEGWRIDGYLMGDEERFRANGVLPAVVPKFKFGFASPAAVWIQYQSTNYYNRHLVLHEGVHALALHLFGGGGPSWYMEGMAELLATHRDRIATEINSSTPLLAQSARRFLINDLPRNRQESPMWGRYRVVRERREAKSLPTLASVMKLPMNMDGDVHSYTWCWAVAMMMTSYPDTRDLFVQAANQGRDQSPAFTTKLFRELQDQWPVLRARWQLWLNELEYGFEPKRNLVDLSVDDPRHDGRMIARSIDSQHGWQSMGVWFPQKSVVRMRAEGKCVIASQASLASHPHTNDDETILTRDWVSEPSGITAYYHRGHPIGQLQVCVLPIPNQGDKSIIPLDIRQFECSLDGPMKNIEITRPSWLLFRVHDAPGNDGPFQRADNQGQYRIVLQ